MPRLNQLQIYIRWFSYLIISILAWSGLTFGAEWSVESTMRTRGQFTDNLRLTNQDHEAVWGSWVTPSLQLQYATEVFKISLNPNVEHVRYFGDARSEVSFTNVFVPFSSMYTTESYKIGLNYSFARSNALISELEETGIVTDFLQRNRNFTETNYEYFLDERVTFQANYQFTDVMYDKGLQSGLFDFQTHTGSIGVIYQATEESHVTGTASYSNFHSPDSGSRSQSPGFDLLLSQRLFETITISGNAGGRYAKTTLQANGIRSQRKNIVWLFGVSLKKEWERDQVSVNYARSLNPNGRGELAVTDRVSVSLNRQLAEHIQANVMGTLTENSSIGNSSGGGSLSDTRYWQIGPSLSWRWRENWFLNLSYHYAQRTIEDNVQGTASANTLNFAITYNFPKWSISR